MEIILLYIVPVLITWIMIKFSTLVDPKNYDGAKSVFILSLIPVINLFVSMVTIIIFIIVVLPETLEHLFKRVFETKFFKWLVSETE